MLIIIIVIRGLGVLTKSTGPYSVTGKHKQYVFVSQSTELSNLAVSVSVPSYNGNH